MAGAEGGSDTLTDCPPSMSAILLSTDKKTNMSLYSMSRLAKVCVNMPSHDATQFDCNVKRILCASLNMGIEVSQEVDYLRGCTWSPVEWTNKNLRQ